MYTHVGFTQQDSVDVRVSADKGVVHVDIDRLSFILTEAAARDLHDQLGELALGEA